MSGIVGLLEMDGGTVERHLLHELTTALAFRGPDGRRVWTAGPVGLGHTLFKTTPESEQERQPMSLDGEVWIAADARIDGRRELIDRLRAERSEADLSATDPELILRAYRTWGEACVSYLIGDFSFAIWDARERRLFCAVDHWGVKPFYYAQRQTTFVFSNTLDVLRQHPKVRDELDETAIGDFLLFGRYLDSDITAFADVSRLPPAHALTVVDGRVTRRCYWELAEPGEARFASASACLEHFLGLLDEAVADRVRTNRVGVFMSGGVDSPMIAASAKRALAAGHPAGLLTAVTIAFDRLFPDGESRHAALAAQALDIPIERVTADDFRLYPSFPEVVWPSPEPVHNPRWPWHAAYLRRAAQTARVYLTGWDGDAVLAAAHRLHWRHRMRWSQWKQLLADAGWFLRTQRRLPPVGFRTALQRIGRRRPEPQLPRWLAPDFVRRAGLSDRLHANTAKSGTPPSPRGPARAQLVPAGLTVLMDGYDSSYIGCGLEVRHPLLDVRLVGFLLSLPAVPWCVDKHLFRRAIARDLPPAIHARPKSPLADDPITASLRQMVAWEGDSFLPHPALSRFVERARVPPLAGCADVNYAWSNVLPLRLNQWLTERRQWDEEYGAGKPARPGATTEGLRAT
jgi:asparagine synthase (glutamine-hydrolysing)